MRCIELFSGAGGLALGLEKAGFETVAHFEWNAVACATLRRNRPDWQVVQGDVRDAKFAQYRPVDLVAGGPPCQPFSMGGKAGGYDDTRDMFPQAVRAVRELRPKAFLFENVRGLMRPAFRNYVEYIRLQLMYPDFTIADADCESNLARLQKYHTSPRAAKGLRYKVLIHVANAADHGVPQHRHRVFFVGYRDDVPGDWCFPLPTHSGEVLRRAQCVTGDYWREHGLTVAGRIAGDELGFAGVSSAKLRWNTVRDALRGLPNPQKRNAINGHIFQPGARSYPGHTGSPIDEPSKALKAGGHGVPGGENMIRFEDDSIRYYSIREAARIQTFPDDWRIEGSWGECMRQIGNAVPVELAYAVAKSVSDRLMVSHVGTLQSAR
jgi:DNA (cytosine-5)-methyltransferase 1